MSWKAEKREREINYVVERRDNNGGSGKQRLRRVRERAQVEGLMRTAGFHKHFAFWKNISLLQIFL